MAGNPDAIQRQASKEATDWLILLKDEPDDAGLRHAFEAWLRLNPLNAAAWEATQRASEVMDKAPPVHADHWRPLLGQLRADAQKSRPAVPEAGGGFRPGFSFLANSVSRQRALVFGGIVMAACVVAAVSGPGLLRHLLSDYATGTAEIRTIRLADESIVTLAPESAIAIDDTPGERRIRLLAGEAFFDVAPDRQRPFRVMAKAVDVTVLGTAFDVRIGETETGVAVEHGLVRVDHTCSALPPGSETLGAGEAVQVSWAGGAKRSAGFAEQVAPWRRNQLIARDEPLRILVQQLGRYYAGKIIVTDDALSARPVTGVYNLADPVEALRGIARAQNAVIRRITPWLIIVSAS